MSDVFTKAKSIMPDEYEYFGMAKTHPWQSIAGLRMAWESTARWSPVYWQMLTEIHTVLKVFLKYSI